MAGITKKSGNQENCAKLHNGDELSEDQEKIYGNVGFLLIFSRGTLSSICSGYLIRSDVVLTAQHCIADNNQNPYDPEDFEFTFDSLSKMVKDQENNIPRNVKSIQSVIPWSEAGEQYRDVALLKLRTGYDELHAPFDLMQTSVPDNKALITLSGYGNYVKGRDTQTFDQGNRLIGQGKFNSYTDIEQFPDFDNSNFIESADYLSVLPDTTGRNQMICQGDSGSSAFWDNGAMVNIVGVTSMQDTRGDSPEAACVNSAEGLFVPAHRIRPWVNQQLTNINSKYVMETYTTLKGEVLDIVKGTNSDKVKVKLVGFIDNGLALTGDEFTFDLCKNESCKVSPTLYSAMGKDSLVLFKIKQEQNINYIQQAVPSNYSLFFETEINATIVSSETSETIEGRSEKVYKIKYSDPSGNNPKVPWNYELLSEAVFCTSGCSKNSQVVTSGFELQSGKGIKAKVSVIHGKIYFRTIAAEPSYDSEKVEYTRAGMEVPSQPILASNAAKTCQP